MPTLRITLARRSWRVALGDSTTLGRDESNSVAIGDAFVSRFHAVVERRDDGFVLRDLGTANGTQVNGERTAYRELQDGDEIRMGTAVLVFDSVGSQYDTGELDLTDDVSLLAAARWLALEADPEYLPQQTIGDSKNLRRPYEKLRVANALARSLGNAPDLPALLERILETTSELFRSDRGAVLILDPRTGEMVRERAYRRTDAAGKIELPQGLVDHVISSRCGALSSIHERPPNKPARSLVCAPMVHRHQVHGLLYLDADRAEAFDLDDLELLSAVANQAGVAVHNALLVKRIQSAETAERARLDALISALPDAVFLLDDKHRIVTSNPVANELLPVLDPWDPSATLDEDSMALHELAGVPIKEVILRARKGGFELSLEEQRRWFRIDSPAPGAADRHTVLVIRETTGDRQQRQLSVQQERLAVVGQLAAGVAHEVNNPLTYVLANLDFLAAELETNRDRVPAESYADLDEALREAREGAGRVRAIVHDLKMFSRTEEQTVGPVDVHETIDSALKMLSNEIRHRARLVRDYQVDVPAVASRSGLSQLFLNLLINSTQALKVGDADNNEIRVATRLAAGTGNVAVEISDSGGGVPEKLRKKIFEPFFTTKPVGGGTGLGLFVCHNIVSALGGSIEVRDRPGGGALFRVELPSTVSNPGDEPPTRPFDLPLAPAPAPADRQVRVLVIDDDPRVLKAMGRQLRDHDVTPCGDGELAVELLRANDYDIVLCDLMMPGLSGMDIYARVQAFAPDRAARMVFMTGGAFTERAAQFLETVDNARLEKPVPLERLREIAEAARSNGA